jgi:hypothetical protein
MSDPNPIPDPDVDPTAPAEPGPAPEPPDEGTQDPDAPTTEGAEEDAEEG